MMHYLGKIPQMAEVGGKARELDRLMRQGFRVPPGIALDNTTWATEGWCQEVFIALQGMEGPFAVRSSATKEDTARESMAGIFLSKTRVPKAEIVAAIMEVREHARTVHGADIPVIVQVWIEGSVSGIAFSRHPTKSLGEMGVIDTALGGAEALVNGSATPERGFVWKDGALLPDGLPLSLEHSRELQAIMWKAHEVLQGPVDIEWTFDGSSVWVLQARPMTRLPPEQAEDQEEGRIMREYAAQREMRLGRSDYAETVPRPSPATLHLLRMLYMPHGPFARAAKHFGLSFNPSAAGHYLTTLFGWLYADAAHEPIELPLGWLQKLRVSLRLQKEVISFPKRFYQTPLLTVPSPSDLEALHEMLLSSPQAVNYASVALLARIAEKQPWVHGHMIQDIWNARQHWLASRTGRLMLQDMELGHEGSYGERRVWNEPERLIDLYAILREDAKDELRPLFDVLRQAYLRTRPEALALPSEYTGVELPLTIVWSDLFDVRSASSRELQQHALRGTGVSFGEGRGAAVIPPAPSEIPAGSILVLPSLSPEWFSHLTPHIAGIVSETGSLMSHGAIQCRERGIPAVFGVLGATRLIRPGELIAVHGKTGSVEHVGERDDKWL